MCFNGTYRAGNACAMCDLARMKCEKYRNIDDSFKSYVTFTFKNAETLAENYRVSCFARTGF